MQRWTEVEPQQSFSSATQVSSGTWNVVGARPLRPQKLTIIGFNVVPFSSYGFDVRVALNARPKAAKKDPKKKEGERKKTKEKHLETLSS